MKHTGRRGNGRIGWHGYASILQNIRWQPRTAVELAEELCFTRFTCYQVVQRMHALKLIHIAGWQLRAVKSRGYSAVWGYGPGENAPYPGRAQHRIADPRKYITSEMVAFAAILRMLVQPVTMQEISDHTGCSVCTLSALLRHMREISMARIGDWLPRINGGSPAAMWVLGSGANKARPARLTPQEIYQRRRIAKLARDETLALIRATAAPITELEAA